MKNPPTVLQPSTTGSIPTEEIEKAVRDVADARKKGVLAKFEIGDTVDVHMKVMKEGEERIQVFTGTVIDRRGTGEQETFTVRRLQSEEDQEREFPLDPQHLERVEVKRPGVVRRVRLRFLSDRNGDSPASQAQPAR